MKLLFVQKMNGISGSELYMLQIMPELKRRGYDIEMLIIYPEEGTKNRPFISYLAERGITTHEIYNHHALSPVLFLKIKKLLDKGRYDIIQTNLIHAGLWLCIVKVWLKKRIKVISVKHGYYPAYQARYGYDFRYLKRDAYYWIEKWICRVADFNFTISRGLYNVYVTGGITTPNRIRNIYYGLTLTKPVQETTVAVPEGDYVLITGRLVGFKGHPYLLKAWKRVQQQCPELKLAIAGDGECRNELEAMVRQEGIERTVLFLGHVPNPHPLMEKCVFTIVTSTWEGFGLILLESWLHKKPVLAFDAPAMNEVIRHGQSGWLVKMGDTEALADAIIYLYHNRERVNRMGENGYNSLHSFFTLKRMTDETEEVYNAIYENRPVPLQEQTPSQS